MTQGYLLSPTIFNVVVDVVVRHWVKVIVEGANDQGGHGQEERHQNSLLYVDVGMVVLLDPGWLQGALSTLVGLFGRVGLNTNSGKTVGMVCRPCEAEETQLEAAYKRKMTGVGPSYWERQCVRVQCTE